MAARKSSKKAKATSQPAARSGDKTAAETIIIDGKAEDITAKAKAAPSAKNASANPSARPKTDPSKAADGKPEQPQTKGDNTAAPKPKTPLSAFAIVLAVVALGLAGWSVFMAQKNLNPPWRGAIENRLASVEASRPDDSHLARQKDVMAMQQHLNRLTERVAGLSSAVNSRIDDLAKMAADGSSSGASNTSAEGQGDVIQTLQNQIETLEQEMRQLTEDMAVLTVQLDDLTAAPQPVAPTEPPSAPPPEASAEDASWWQSLFGSIRISRLPDNGAE